MLDILSKHLTITSEPSYCVVHTWIASLSEEEQLIMRELKNNPKVVLAQLFYDLTKETELPFKITVFRAHMKGYCVCPKS